MTPLIPQLEAARGADRELDARVWCHVNGLELRERPTPASSVFTHEMFVRVDGEVEILGHRRPNGSLKTSSLSELPTYTASIDAALALVREVLPDAGYTLSWGEEGHAATLWEWVEQIGENGPAMVRQALSPLTVHQSAPLAILIALLRALEVEGES